MARRDRSFFFDNKTGKLQSKGKVISDATNTTNILQTKGATTGNPVGINAIGDDTNIDITITPKGSGEINIAAGDLNYAGTAITATGAELNILDGVTATAAELNYVDGVTSNIQTQLDAKLPLAGGTMSGAIAMGTSKITGMGDPTANQDAATKAYVDGQVSTANDATITITASTGLTGSGAFTTDQSADETITLSIDSTVATLTGTQTLTNKTLTTPVISSISNTGTLTLPTSTDTLVGRATTDTLTNKSISGGDNTLTNIPNSALSNNSITVARQGGNSTAIALGGTITFNNVANETTVAESSGTITIGLANDVTIPDLTVSGNLTVSGTTTTLSTTNSVVSDSLIELNNGASSNSNDLGIVMERGSTGDNAIFMWDESADKFVVGTTTATGASTGNLSVTTGTLVANIEGNVTGDVTGNADTATALATARNIAGNSFDGSGDITIASTDLSDTSNLVRNNQNNTITSTTAGSSAGPEFELFRDITGADANYIGQILFSADNDADQKTVFAKITGKIGDASDGTEDGIIEIAHKKAGSNNIGIRITSTEFKIMNGMDFDVETHDGSSNGLRLANTLVTATAAELNLLDGVTATTTELNYVDGVTSAIQTQLDAKTSNTGTVTSVSGTGTVSGLTLSGTVTTSGSLTLGGTLSITESQISDLGSYITASSTDTLTNKTLTNPTINAFTGTGNGTITGNLTVTSTMDADTYTTDGLTLVDNNILSNRSNDNINLIPSGTGTVTINGSAFPTGFGTDGYVLTTDGAGTLTWAEASGGGQTAGHTIQNAGSNLTQRAGLNFDGTYLVATDDSGNSQTDVTVSSTLQTIAGLTYPSGVLVGTSDTQTLTNKTVDSASNTLTLDLSEGTLTGTTAEFNTALSDDSFVTLTNTATLTNKTLTSPTINTGTLASNTVTTALTLNAQADLRFADSDSSNWVAFQAPATISSNVTWTLPSEDGSNTQVLTTDGSGTLSWTDGGGGGGASTLSGLGDTTISSVILNDLLVYDGSGWVNKNKHEIVPNLPFTKSDGTLQYLDFENARDTTDIMGFINDRVTPSYYIPFTKADGTSVTTLLVG